MVKMEVNWVSRKVIGMEGDEDEDEEEKKRGTKRRWEEG
jgi:hypothetical protein